MKIKLKNNKIINPYSIFYNKNLLYKDIKDKINLINKLEYLKKIDDYNKLNIIMDIFDIELDDIDYKNILNQVLGDYKIYNINTNLIQMEKIVSLKNLNSVVEYFNVGVKLASSIYLNKEVIYNRDYIKDLINSKKVVMLKYYKTNKADNKLYKDNIIDNDLCIYNMKIDNNNLYIDIINKFVMDIVNIEYIDNIIIELNNNLKDLLNRIKQLIDIEQNNIIGQYNDLEVTKNKCKILINSGGINGQNNNKRSS